MPKPGAELWLGEAAGGLDADRSGPGSTPVGFVDAVAETVPDGSGSDDEQLAVGRDAGGDGVDEASEVLVDRKSVV